MEEWIRHALSTDQAGLAAIPAAFVFGLIGSAMSCSAFPMIGAVVGYAGALAGRHSRREVVVAASSFALGTIASLGAIGATAGLVGEAAGAWLGKYWRPGEGLVMVLFGLVTAGLLQLRAPRLRLDAGTRIRGVSGSVVFGLAVGGTTTACSFGCNPLLPMAVGAAVVRGATALGAAMLAAFAAGYTLPLVGGVLGIGLGAFHLGQVAKRVIPVVRAGGGTVMVIVGFYLLANP